MGILGGRRGRGPNIAPKKSRNGCRVVSVRTRRGYAVEWRIGQGAVHRTELICKANAPSRCSFTGRSRNFTSKVQENQDNPGEGRGFDAPHMRRPRSLVCWGTRGSASSSVYTIHSRLCDVLVNVLCSSTTFSRPLDQLESRSRGIRNRCLYMGA